MLYAVDSLKLKMGFLYNCVEWLYQRFGSKFGITCHAVDIYDILKAQLYIASVFKWRCLQIATREPSYL